MAFSYEDMAVINKLEDEAKDNPEYQTWLARFKTWPLGKIVDSLKFAADDPEGIVVRYMAARQAVRERPMRTPWFSKRRWDRKVRLAYRHALTPFKGKLAG